MTRFPLLLALALTTVVAQTPKQVLVDFRQDRITTPPKITPATQKFVLSKVFRRYLTDENNATGTLLATAWTIICGQRVMPVRSFPRLWIR
jgi:hypothetical protein